MLKLKKLQILGFKSFCDRTELRFHGDGVAAIVGPNGCGKSNIADAICWVLGEQSAKSLRGTRMEDVIFAGTPARKATGMAEVSLTLIDPEVYEGAVSTEPEVEITDELPEEDWDEAALRTAADDETGQYIEAMQPGVVAGETSSVASPTPTDGAAVIDEGMSPDSNDQRLTTSDEHRTGDTEPAAECLHMHVVLKIRRRKFKPVPLKKGEIIVTRRLFRSGDSEYLLNHKLCRLRDIQDIFMGTGLGPESYAIIEQGRIGQILSSKPTDRRAIIEEAAGITKYKTRKRLAEARLEDARQNLNRVNDIFEEVTRQMNSLKRQAAKASRYVRLRDEMRAKLRLVLSSRFAQLQLEAGGAKAELQQTDEQVQALNEGVQRMDGEHRDRTQRGYSLDAALRESQEAKAAIARETDRATSRQRQNEERCAELTERTAMAERELGVTATKLEALHAERTGSREVLDSADSEAAGVQEELLARQQDAVSAAAALTSLEKQQEMRRVSILEAANAAAGVRNRITQAEENMAALVRESQRLQNEISSANLQLENFGGERGQLALEFESAAQRVEALATEIDRVREQLEQKRREESESKARLDGLRAASATALGRKTSLEAVITEHAYSTDSVRRLFSSGTLENGFVPAGVLADFLEVEDQYEHVVEDFLREELNYVVVKSWDAADRGLEMLRTDVDGRATFLVHPHDAQARFPFDVPDDLQQQAMRRNDRVVPLTSCIRVLNGFGKSLEVILPKLRDGYIVPSAEFGRELALENPDAFFLARSGECFHNVTVTGGTQAKEGPLTLKRELREVLRDLSELERSLMQEQTRVQEVAREIAGLVELLQRLQDERREADKQAMTSDHTLRQLDSEMARVRERLGVYERELDRTNGERTVREAYVAEQQEEFLQREHMRTELEQALEVAQQQLAELRRTRDSAEQIASEVRARAAVLEERRRAAAQTLQRVESLIHEVSSRLEALQLQVAAASRESLEKSSENQQLAERLIALAAEAESCQLRETEFQVESGQVRSRIAELEEELRDARKALDEARDQRARILAVLAKLESDVTYLGETCQNELTITLEQLRADESLAPVQGDQLAAEDAAYRDLRARIDGLGPVYMGALEEYAEVSKRREFLEAQQRDLTESIANLHATIREIEVFTNQKFREAFACINENFQATFRKLFGGGQAFMKLTDEANAEESGIDVVASPPGKRLQNVLLLSGGEKALTALSLLVGIFQYQPSPFCILDEVDAPLDDTNIGRFTDLVREMSVQTQFVLITHSRKTMKVAPVMYGVTMQEPGVSKLVSVRFAEPQPETVN